MKKLILGLDPGSRRTGFGLIEADGDRFTHVAHGVIRLNETQALAYRLGDLAEQLSGLYRKYPITHTVIEKIFFGKNAESAFILGHARGVCLMVAAQNQVPIEEYAARFVKKSITGSGAATKEHVQLVVVSLLRLREKSLALDASDALSLALTCAQMNLINERFDAQPSRRNPLKDRGL